MFILVPREVAKTLLILCGIVAMLVGIVAVISGDTGQKIGGVIAVGIGFGIFRLGTQFGTAKHRAMFEPIAELKSGAGRRFLIVVAVFGGIFGLLYLMAH